MQLINAEIFLEVYKSIVQPVKWENVPAFIPSSTQDETLQFICKFGGPEKTIFEFGTFVGRSALGFSQNFKQVVSIDCQYGSDVNYLDYDSGVLARDVPNVELIQADSRFYDYTRFTGCFDVVFVDGNHSIPGATIDMHTAIRIAKPNGIIFVDDATNDMFGVPEAIRRFPFKPKYTFEDLGMAVFLK